MIIIFRTVLLFAVLVSGTQAGFDEAYKNTAQIEGGYVYNPDDRGGVTYKGIAQKANPHWFGWELIKTDMKRTGRDKPSKSLDQYLASHVKNFYYKNYWLAVKADRIPDEDIAHEIYDIAVNQGVRWAGKIFQRSINYYNRNQRDYPNVKVDGVIGTQTIAAYHKFATRRARIAMYVCGQLVYSPPKYPFLLKVFTEKHRVYARLTERDERQEAFALGWYVRTMTSYARILKEPMKTVNQICEA